MRLALVVFLCFLVQALYPQRICYSTDSIAEAGEVYDERVEITLDTAIVPGGTIEVFFPRLKKRLVYVVARESHANWNCAGFDTYLEGDASRWYIGLCQTRVGSFGEDQIAICDDPTNYKRCLKFIKPKGIEKWGKPCGAKGP